MKIAVIMGGIRFDCQKRILNGIIEKAKEDQADVYVFSCDVWSYSTTQFITGEMEIYKLPDFTNYDGVIIHGDTLYNAETIANIVQKVHDSGVPCVNLTLEVEGMANLSMENDNGITLLINHLVEKHGAKTINFISGPEGNFDGEGRLNAYKKALEEHGMEIEDHRIYFGDYHPKSGMEAVEFFADSGLDMPDAIMAANDEMALGALYELERRGYRIPEDIMITGYDNIYEAQNHAPRITSVQRPEKELGRKAYTYLMDEIAGKPKIGSEQLLSWPVFAESCGCRCDTKEDFAELRRKLAQDRIETTTYTEIIKASSADFVGVETQKDLFEKIRKYIAMLDPEEFYLCLGYNTNSINTDIMSHLNTEAGNTDLLTYPKDATVPIAYRNGHFETYGRFHVNELLPEKYKVHDGGMLYTIVPVHYQERTYGYCVLGKSRLLIDSSWFHLFIMNINNALESVRKQEVMNAMVERLNRMWVYDTLTGIFNRAGFFKFSSAIVKEAQERGKPLFVLFLDLDGLKKVNDQYGHDEGDTYIKAMANVLNQVRKHGELLMRYGGDEFVILSKGYTDADAKNYISQIQTGIENYNANSNHEYTLEASIGYTIVEPAPDLDIEEIIETADQEMYKMKKAKKAARRD